MPSRIIRAQDPPVILRPVVSLSVLQLIVPVGTISRNDALWKKIEERAIDAAAYDILQKNGIRVGLGAAADLGPLLRSIDRTQLRDQSNTLIASNVKTVELPMKLAVPQQTVDDFNLKNILTVRTYEQADDIFILEFGPAPRKAGDVRISMVPMIRTLRKRLVPMTDRETQELEYRNPEKFFALNLRLDLPLDAFLILAPSPEARDPMSLGHTFLITSGDTQEYETILLISPQVMKLPTTRQ